MSGEVALVTGGSGFVGSHLVEALLDRGDEVHVLDAVPLDEARNLDDVRDHPRLHYVEGDLRSRADLERFYRPEASVLFHLASVVGIPYYLDDPLALIDVVVGGTRNLLEMARVHGTKVIFSSTSEIYGRNPSVPWSEDSDRVLGPSHVDRWSYSSSKAVCEHMLYGLRRQSGLPFSIVRFFNAYGPRQSPNFVISRSVYRVLRGEPPLCYDGGRQTRCFTYVGDVVAGLLAVAATSAAEGEAFNLGHREEVTVREALETVLSQAGAETGVRAFDTDEAYGAAYEDVPRRVPSVDKAERLLGWRAEIPLSEGVARTLAWARANPWWIG